MTDLVSKLNVKTEFGAVGVCVSELLHLHGNACGLVKALGYVKDVEANDGTFFCQGRKFTKLEAECASSLIGSCSRIREYGIMDSKLNGVSVSFHKTHPEADLVYCSVLCIFYNSISGLSTELCPTSAYMYDVMYCLLKRVFCLDNVFERLDGKYKIKH